MSQKILVVDDEREIVKLVRTYLEKAGFRVVTANDGQEGLTVFRHEKPDLVVLDLNLPLVDGLDVCRTIQRESDTPVIMLTARVEEQDRLIGLELGADDYIVKPFSPCEVVARVRAVLWRRRSFGTQSEDGSHFVERVLTAVTTLRQQKRDVLDYLTEACAAAIRGDKAPSLLPNTLVIQSGV